MVNAVDVFVLYDSVQYTKNDWRNRNSIKTQSGPKWLSIPIEFHLGQKIRDIEIKDGLWRKKHWSSIAQSYAKSEHLKRYKNDFEELYLGSQESSLSQVNRGFIELVNRILGIKTALKWSWEYDLGQGKSERLLRVCQQEGATCYLSGPAAKDYLDVELFEQNNVRVEWMDYSGYPEYRQLFPPFAHGVSVLDLIFNEGPDAPKFMKSFGNHAI